MGTHSNVSYCRIDNVLLMEGVRQGILKQSFLTTQTTLTMNANDPPVLFLTPTAAMTITLPAATKGLSFELYNRATVSTLTLTVNDPTGPTLVKTIASVSSQRFIADGLNWLAGA